MSFGRNVYWSEEKQEECSERQLFQKIKFKKKTGLSRGMNKKGQWWEMVSENMGEWGGLPDAAETSSHKESLVHKLFLELY